jgi:hypothetical protein
MLSYCLLAPLFKFDPYRVHVGSPYWGPRAITRDHQGIPRAPNGTTGDRQGILKDHQPPRHPQGNLKDPKGTPRESQVTLRGSSRGARGPQPGAPRSTQEHPGAPRSTQEHPGAPRSTQEHPGAPRRTQAHPGAPRSTQEHPGASRSTQEHPRSTPGARQGDPSTKH